MSDVSEKLAAAGFGPRTEHGDEILVFIPGDAESSHTGIAERSGHRFGKTWDDEGKNFCGTGSGWDLVPLPPPQQEPERLSDQRIQQIISFCSGDCKEASNARIFDERWELANEVSELRAKCKRLSEITDRDSGLLREYSERIVMLTKERNKAIEEGNAARADFQTERRLVSEREREICELREQVATLTRERTAYLESSIGASNLRDEAYREIKRLTRERDQQIVEVVAVLDSMPGDCAVRVCEGGGPENVFASLAVSVAKLIQQRDELATKSRVSGNSALWVDVAREQKQTAEKAIAERDQYRELCRRFRNVMTSGELKSLQNEYDSMSTDTPAPAEDATRRVVEAAIPFIHQSSEHPDKAIKLWRDLRDAIHALEAESPQ